MALHPWHPGQIIFQGQAPGKRTGRPHSPKSAMKFRRLMRH
jgi:hypothetical protein